VASRPREDIVDPPRALLWARGIDESAVFPSDPLRDLRRAGGTEREVTAGQMRSALSLFVVGCAAACATPTGEVASGEDDVTAARPEIWFEGESAVGARGLPASAPDGTVAVLDRVASRAGEVVVLNLKRADDWEQHALVVATPDGRLTKQPAPLGEARVALGAKAFRSFTPAKPVAGTATVFEHRVTIDGTSVKVSSEGAAPTSISFENDLLEVQSINVPGCRYTSVLDEAYVSRVRNLVYARIDFRANGQQGCDDARTYVAAPLR
jgi:hypothetical protein